MRPNLDSQAGIFRSRFQGKGMWLSVEVDNVDAQLLRIQALGESIEMGIRDEPWGDRHFAIVDPNGIAVDVVQRMQAA